MRQKTAYEHSQEEQAAIEEWIQIFILYILKHIIKQSWQYNKIILCNTHKLWSLWQIKTQKFRGWVDLSNISRFELYVWNSVLIGDAVLEIERNSGAFTTF